MRFSDAVEKQLHLHILHSTRPLLVFFFLNLFFMAEIGVVGLDRRGLDRDSIDSNFAGYHHPDHPDHLYHLYTMLIQDRLLILRR